MIATSPTSESRYLLNIAQSVADAYVSHTGPAAILVTGSVAEGVSDQHSDIDLIFYYDQSPTTSDLVAARSTVNATAGELIARREPDPGRAEEYEVHGVECQIGLQVVADWERDLSTVLNDHVPGTLTEKAIIGLVRGRALHGGDRIDRWKRQAADYPEGLARVTVAHHLPGIVPLWLSPERWAPRDATVFWHQALSDSALRLFGVLAGLNRRYYSTFQLKRLHRLADDFRFAPAQIADRIDALFACDPIVAADDLERLTAETMGLVETHLPSVDTSATRALIGRRIQPWEPVPA